MATVAQEAVQEEKVATSTKLIAFFLKNQKQIVIAAVVLVLAIAGYFAWRWYQGSQNNTAAERIGFAIRQYENGLFRQSLDGSGQNAGFLKLINEYGGTETGNLAKFYAAAALDQLNERKQALQYYEGYDKGEDLIGAAAYAGAAAIYEDVNKDHAKAAEMYKKAANTYPDETSAPDYLRKAARNFELAKAFGDARDAYKTIKEKYPKSPLAGNIDYYLARVDALEGKK